MPKPIITRAQLKAKKPAEGGVVLKTHGSRVRAINTEERTIDFILSSAAIDSHGDSIDQAGWELEQYKRNGSPMLAYHDHRSPIGNAKSIEVRNGALMATALFAKDVSGYPLPDMMWDMYSRGHLRAVSVGFWPIEFTPRLDEESGMIEGFDFQKQELYEFSCVTVGSNPDAMTLSGFGEGVLRMKAAGEDPSAMLAFMEKEPTLRVLVRSAERAMAAAPVIRIVKAEPGELAVNDFVEWNGADGTEQGQITALKNDGDLNVSTGDNEEDMVTITGSEDDPAASIRIWGPNDEEDGFAATDQMTAQKCSSLAKIAPLNGSKGGKPDDDEETDAMDPEDDENGEDPDDDKGGGGSGDDDEDEETKKAVAQALLGYPDAAPALLKEVGEFMIANAKQLRKTGNFKPGNIIAVAEVAGMKAASDYLLGLKTNFPADGDDHVIALKNSAHRTAPLAYVRDLKANWPAIWALGDAPDALAKLYSADDSERREAIVDREDWAAAHAEKGDVRHVVNQLQRLVAGPEGHGYQKEVIAAEQARLVGLAEEKSVIRIVG